MSFRRKPRSHSPAQRRAIARLRAWGAAPPPIWTNVVSVRGPQRVRRDVRDAVLRARGCSPLCDYYAQARAEYIANRAEARGLAPRRYWRAP